MSYHAYQQLIHDTGKAPGLDEYPYTLEEHQSGLATLVFAAPEGVEQEPDIVFLGYRRASNELVVSQGLDTLDADNELVRRHALQHDDERSDPATPFAGIVADQDNGNAITVNLCLPPDDGIGAEALMGHIGHFMDQSSEFIKQATAPESAGDTQVPETGAIRV